MKTQKLSKGISAIICIVIAGMLIGCGTRKKKSDNLTFMVWGDVYNRPFFESLARQYNKTNPKVKVEIFAPPAQYFDKLVTMAAGNNLCDVTLMAGPQYDLLAYKEQLLPLDDYFKSPQFADVLPHIMPNTIIDGKRRGKVYGMPVWTWTINFYYNKSLLERFGVGELTGKWNWNDFLNICRKVTRRDNIKERSFGSDLLTGGHYIQHDIMLKQNGLSLFSSDMQRCVINSPAHFKIYQYLFDLTLKHKVCVTKGEAESVTSEAGKGGAFGSGMVAFRSGGREQADIMNKARLPFTWDVVKLPTDSKDAFVTVNAYVGISKNTKKSEAAHAFVKWLAGEQGQRLITLRRMDISVYKPLTYSSQFENMLGMRRMNILYRDCIENAVPADPRFPNIQEFQEIIKNKYELVNEGGYDLRRALNEIAAAYDNLKE